MQPETLQIITGALFVISIAIFIYTVYGLQKKLVIKDAMIDTQIARIEECIAKEKFYLSELNRWETYNVGLLGDLAHLVDNPDLNKRNEIRTKWKMNFSKKKEMFKEKQGMNRPEAKN